MTLEAILDLDYLSLQDIISLSMEIEAADRLDSFLDNNLATNGDKETIGKHLDGVIDQGFPRHKARRRQEKSKNALGGLKSFLGKAKKR